MCPISDQITKPILLWDILPCSDHAFEVLVPLWGLSDNEYRFFGDMMAFVGHVCFDNLSPTNRKESRSFDSLSRF